MNSVRSPFISRHAMATRGTKPVSLMRLDPVYDASSKLKTTRWVASTEVPATSTAPTEVPVTSAPTEVTAVTEVTEVTEGTAVTPSTEATASTEVPASSNTSSEELESAESPRTKRQRKLNEYKSIVRTRSQKLREAEMYHEDMLTRLQNHWATWGKEPTAASGAELAEYIQSLRNIHPQNLKPEFVARVTETNPWFKWSTPAKQRTWCHFMGNVVLFSGAVSMVVSAAYLQIKLQDKAFVDFALDKMRATFA